MLSGWFTLPFPPGTLYPISGLGGAMFCIHCRALSKQTHWPLCSQDSFMDSQKEINIFCIYAALIDKKLKIKKIQLPHFQMECSSKAASFESFFNGLTLI